ncbi:XkdX family protein [Bacillus inaquosorum]|uniref:XkdX family protein n=1 Tax=Bacillus inaquosorum TaxID=483913 RepID=UPI001FE5F462|nr:XkdX family protein [Bacillus inaquosorum]
MWQPLFDEEKQTWVETADEEYKEKLKLDSIPETNPIAEQLATLGQQLADEKLARKQAEQAMAFNDCSVENMKEGVQAKYITHDQYQEVTGIIRGNDRSQSIRLFYFASKEVITRNGGNDCVY